MPILEEERTFEYFQDCLPHMRQAIIDKMEMVPRITFTACSKLAKSEGQASRNYLRSIIFKKTMDCGLLDVVDKLSLEVSHGEDRAGTLLYYYLNFEERRGKKYVTCISNGQKIWKNELNNSKTLEILALEKLKNMLNTFKNSVRCLSMRGGFHCDFDFGPEILKSLGSLRVAGQYAHQLVLKTRKPLGYFCVYDGDDAESLEDCEQVYKAQILDFPTISFNLAQVLRFNAKKFTISLGNLSEQDIAHFINLWKNGKELEKCEWHFNGSRFNVEHLFKLLGLQIGDKVKQNGTGKLASLKRTAWSLEFNCEL